MPREKESTDCWRSSILPSELVHATEQARAAGYRRMECYTPYPVEEAAEALHFHKNRVPLVCLLGGLMGVTTAFLMETWISVWAYPLNIAGRPLFSGRRSSSRRTSGRFCSPVFRRHSE